MPKIDEIEIYLLKLQENICTQLESHEPEHRFHRDAWQRNEADHSLKGSGKSWILSNGLVFEKVGVNFSHVHGSQLPNSATQKRTGLAGRAFRALGLSVVIHPKNPFIPTAHMNVRFLIAEHPTEESIWWFGGGFDLTPYYGFKEDCEHWHQMAKNACDSFDKTLYPRYKKWADDYFYLPHRKEARGIGGLFFDDLNTPDLETCFSFMRSVGDHFTKAYLPIVERRKKMPFTEQERAFQLYRRGRYVEFNLLYDRGTLFGLQSGGRTESILMSLPPLVAWQYDWKPEKNSREAGLLKDFLEPRDWLAK